MQPTYHAQPRREIPGENAETARLSAMVVALLQELSITRERLDTVERLLAQGGVFAADAVETFTPDAEAEAARTQLRQRMIGVVMQPLKADAERAREAIARAAQKGRNPQGAADAILDKEFSQ